MTGHFVYVRGQIFHIGRFVYAIGVVKVQLYAIGHEFSSYTKMVIIVYASLHMPLWHLWCPGQVPAVLCRCWPALPSYAAPRTSFHGLREGLLFAGSVAISVAQTNDVHTGGSNDRFFLWWLLNSFSTVVAQKTPHRIGGSNK